MPHQPMDVSRHAMQPSYRASVTLACLSAVALLVFNLWPWIDLRFSSQFASACSALACSGFPLRPTFWAKTPRDIFQMIPIVFFGGLSLLLIVRLVQRGELMSSWRLVSAWIAMLLSAGLLVNVILKEHWGRPRPFQSTFFGGELPFVPAGEITDFCQRNCSFVSGEVSTAAWLLFLSTLAPARYRAVAVIGAGLFLVLTALFRIALGAHYLSDAVMAVLFTLLVCTLTTLPMAWAANRWPDLLSRSGKWGSNARKTPQ